jgi:pimeloyl-ACP methyl ester carboxylesterase
VRRDLDAQRDRTLHSGPAAQAGHRRDRPKPRDLSAPAFAQLVYDASYSANVFADLPAALRAFATGDRQPLLRLAANDIEFNASGPASYFSIGDLEAVSCNDYPTAWSRAATRAIRRRQLKAQIARLRNAFAPFPASVYLSSYVENELVYGCLDWPSSPGDPPFPRAVRYPDTPTLIFDGEFDFATPLADAERVARAWPHRTLVEVANAKHVTAAGDQEHCTSVILQRFLATLRPGNTACARRMPPIAILPAFPRNLSAAPEVRSHTAAPTIDRQAAWVAVETVADAMNGWFGSGTGAGYPADALRGGTFEVAGDKFSDQPITVRLRGAQFVFGTAVSGTAIWERSHGQVRAHLTIAGPAGLNGKLDVTWHTGISDWRQPAEITGVLDKYRIDAEMRPPWEPQS